MFCSVPECSREDIAGRGWCGKHYQRWYLTGTVDMAQPAECAHCGDALPARRDGVHGPSSKYCSATCRRAASYAKRKAQGTLKNYYRPKAKTSVVCEQCAGEFEASRPVRFCSSKCSQAHRDLENAARCSEVGCGRGVRANGMCSMHWKRARWESGQMPTEPWNERRKKVKEVRKQRERETSSRRPLTAAELVARDGAVCGICDGEIDMTLRYPHAMSLVRDHIVPIARGGAHDPANQQPAHRQCNERKGVRPLEDVREARGLTG